MSAGALGLSGSSIATQSSAAAAITAVQNAIVDVAAQRAILGAMQNRLYHRSATSTHQLRTCRMQKVVSATPIWQSK